MHGHFLTKRTAFQIGQNVTYQERDKPSRQGKIIELHNEPDPCYIWPSITSCALVLLDGDTEPIHCHQYDIESPENKQEFMFSDA